MTRVLVCGGRNYGEVHRHLLPTQVGFEQARAAKEVARLHRVLDAAVARLRLSVLIHGGAFGADRQADVWARARHIPVEVYEAAWDDIERPGAIVRQTRTGTRYDAAAGSLRNQRMLDEGRPEVCIAFPGGTGTRDMVRRATGAGLRVIRIDWQ